MIILGIDPGTHKTGYGIIDFKSGKYSLLDFGVTKTDPKTSLHERLEQIFHKIREITLKWEPEVVSMENIFVKNNINSALLLGHARGTLICATLFQKGLEKKPFFMEFSPLEIKKGIVGTGTASKNQVQIMVKILLNVKDKNIPEDASDALAAAIFAGNNISYNKHTGCLNNQKEINR
jgi:crossover junction endodeoxyribonuclease RuvC